MGSDNKKSPPDDLLDSWRVPKEFRYGQVRLRIGIAFIELLDSGMKPKSFNDMVRMMDWIILQDHLRGRRILIGEKLDLPGGFRPELN